MKGSFFQIKLAFFALVLSQGFWISAQEVLPPVLPVSVVIFPYGSPDPQVTASFGYALFTVPDLLREKLEGGGRFQILDLNTLARTGGSSVDAEDTRLLSAREAGSDYLIWGYLIANDGGLKVIHKVVETREGRTVKVESQDLPQGSALIGALETSAFGFSESLGKTLVPLPPRIQVVEKVVEKIREIPVSDSPGKRNNLEFSTGLTGFAGRYSGVLDAALFFRLELTYPLDSSGVWDWGADLSLQGLKKAKDAVLTPEQTPDLAYLPLLFKSSARWPLLGFLDLGWELKGGGSLIFGTLGGNGLFLLRPSWSTGFLIELWPRESLSLRFHGDLLGTWIDFTGDYLSSVRFGLGIGLDI